MSVNVIHGAVGRFSLHSLCMRELVVHAGEENSRGSQITDFRCTNASYGPRN